MLSFSSPFESTEKWSHSKNKIKSMGNLQANASMCFVHVWYTFGYNRRYFFLSFYFWANWNSHPHKIIINYSLCKPLAHSRKIIQMHMCVYGRSIEKAAIKRERARGNREGKNQSDAHLNVVYSPRQILFNLTSFG